MTRHVLTYGRERIPFDLTYSARKRLTIEVEPDGAVRVLAPEETELETVLARVQRRAKWISRQRMYFEGFKPLPAPKRFVNGETHRYLGRQYRLKFEEGEAEGVKLKGRFFHVVTPERPEPEVVERLLTAWYRQRARAVFEKRMEVCLRSSFLRGLRAPSFAVRKMRRRWGSCTGKRVILLNLNLVKAPPDCIEYVIMHELCHLRIKDHSPRYYGLLTQCMPDWERRKDRLNSVDWDLG